MATGISAGLAGLAGCHPASPPMLRFGVHPWPGYEFIFLAREQGLLPEPAVRLVEMPAASDSLLALIAGTLDGAALTLDEVLSARAAGVELHVCTVVDISLGGDVLIARPGIDTLSALRGRRIGVEYTGTGAIMLDDALMAAGLTPGDIEKIYVTADRHVDAFTRHEVDAVITYEPAATRLRAAGGRVLFDSSARPGHIIDVFAFCKRALDINPAAVRALLAAHFGGRMEYLRDPQKVAPQLARRLFLSAPELQAAFGAMTLPDATDNQRWLAAGGDLESRAANLLRVMRQARLLENDTPLHGLADARFLPVHDT